MAYLELAKTLVSDRERELRKVASRNTRRSLRSPALRRAHAPEQRKLLRLAPSQRRNPDPTATPSKAA